MRQLIREKWIPLKYTTCVIALLMVVVLTKQRDIYGVPFSTAEWNAARPPKGTEEQRRRLLKRFLAQHVLTELTSADVSRLLGHGDGGQEDRVYYYLGPSAYIDDIYFEIRFGKDDRIVSYREISRG